MGTQLSGLPADAMTLAAVPSLENASFKSLCLGVSKVGLKIDVRSNFTGVPGRGSVFVGAAGLGTARGGGGGAIHKVSAGRLVKRKVTDLLCERVCPDSRRDHYDPNKLLASHPKDSADVSYLRI